MSARAQKIPDASHPITIEPSRKRIVVTIGGKVVADTRRALDLRESTYPVVHYIPRADVDMSHFSKTATQTYCPFKGDASYYSATVDGGRVEDAAWSYETPYAAVAGVKEHLAFYTNRVDAIEERDA
ncbi:MAG: DUF427 domain-containing protein [Hyphomicrobiales bacterium]|nr:DUF427 domain-containing protein [Hyphomicrobiales bacterium]